MEDLYLDRANEIVEDSRELERAHYKMLAHIAAVPNLNKDGLEKLLEALSPKIDRTPRGFSKAELERSKQIEEELKAEKNV